MSVADITFAWPWLFLLLPLPLLIRPKPTDESQQAIRLPRFATATRVLQSARDTRAETSVAQKMLLFLIWFLLVTALTRPQFIGDPVDISQSGRDLMLAVDLSESMYAEDMIIRGFKTNRLAAVKSVVSEFISERQGDRMGLIVFGSSAYVHAPLTFDLETVQTLLRESAIGMAGKATAIGDAIGLAVKRLQKRPENSRVLILLTDGTNTAGELSPDQAVELAKKTGIKIYTIGVGTQNQSNLRRGMAIDEQTLQQIAAETGGEYFRARNTGELGLIYENLNHLEPVETEAKPYRPVVEVYFWPLASAFLILMLRLILRELPNLASRLRNLIQPHQQRTEK
ncbi:von Willebrand factor, type A [Oleiphilus messinensis]|uniref:von Willebrand factor, type A n=1 Tax=Oleiphilus messinensis TaxID=141451 RepID=A0A1Y0IB16_9GAMM|nr:VWA domain-containing protein [Oleiphilus messinensis]ARU56583.1 von Willebrand factor, type A [Oleiphilus messinensis]